MNLTVVRMCVLLWLYGTATTYGSPAFEYRQVFGAQAFDSSTGTGFRDPSLGGGVSAAGTAVGTMTKYAGGENLGMRAVRWDDTQAVELGNLGTDTNGVASSQVFAINNAGLSVGTAVRYAGGEYRGERAVRWNSAGTVATELGHLGIGIGEIALAYGSDINESGTAIGTSVKFEAGFTRGARAVRWSSSGTAATELGHLGLLPNGFAEAYAYAINNLGTAVGVSEKPSPSGGYGGSYAVRWDANSTISTELGNLGISSSGQANAVAYDVNDSNTAVGIAFKFVGGTFMGQRGVRWDGSGTVATELETLGFDSNGVGSSYAFKINNHGTAIGSSAKYVAGVDLGSRAVRWAGSSTIPTELGHLGTDSEGFTTSETFDLNENNLIVGKAQKYVGGVSVGTRAVLWRENNAAIDLNSLIDPASGWILEEAYKISDTGWISGVGLFDPDGPGGLDGYSRLFLLHVPEPSSLALVGMAVAALLRCHPGCRRNQSSMVIAKSHHIGN